MTGDEFTARYRLREQLSDGDIVSYLATDARGSDAFVHVFRGESVPEFDPSLLDAEGSKALREVLDVEGIAVVVTEALEPFTTFEAWAAEHEQAPEEEGPGTFTRIFRVQVPEGPPGSPLEPPPIRSEAETGPAQSDPAEAEAGPAQGDPAEVETGPVGGDALEEEGAAPVETEPGEAEPGGPGAFTRAFGAVRTPPPPPAPVEPSEPGPPPSPPARPAASTGTSVPEAPPDEPTREMPSAKTPPPAPRPPVTPPPAPPPPLRPPDPPVERGTGTFTRIMGAVREGPGPAAPPPRPGGTPPPRPAAPPPGASGPPAPPRPPAPPPEPPPLAPPASPPVPPPLAPRQPPPVPPPTEGGTPGPYTLAMRAYKGPGQSRPPAPEEEGAADAGGWGATGSYLDRLQERARPEDTAAPLPPGPPPPRVEGPPAPSGPSDYTRVIRGAAVPPAGRPGPEPPPTFGASPPQPRPQQPKPAPTASRTPIIVALVVTIAVLVAVILFFALRSG